MNTAKAIPGIWVYTTGDAYNAMRTGGYGAFLSDAQKARLERIRQGQLLFDGKHETYFVEERRTRFNASVMLVQGEKVRVYSTFNVLGLSSIKFGDLLFGQAPAIRCDNAQQQQKINDLVKRCNLQPLLHSMATDASYEGEAFVESVVWRGAVYLRQIRAEEIFPQGEIGPDWQFDSYVRFRLANAGTAQSPIWLLLETRYLADAIENAVWQLDSDGRRHNRVGIDAWNQAAGSALVERIATGIGRNVVTYVPNAMVRGNVVSDYDGAIELQDRLNAKDSQVDVILAKHAEPPVAVPREAADPEGNVRAADKVWFYSDPARIPQYVARDLQLEMAIADAKRTLANLCVRIEMSPVLLGVREGGTPDAWKKLKLEASNALKKAERKAAYWTAGLTRAMEVAQDLEQTLPGMRYDRVPLGIEIRDGIPTDEIDMANSQSILRAAGLLSRRRALEQQLGDRDAVETELAELDDEAESQMPTVLLGGSGTREPGETSDNQGNEE